MNPCLELIEGMDGSPVEENIEMLACKAAGISFRR